MLASTTMKLLRQCQKGRFISESQFLSKQVSFLIHGFRIGLICRNEDRYVGDYNGRGLSRNGDI